MTARKRPPLTANGIEILARLRAGQSPERIAEIGWFRRSWTRADIAAVARDWGHRDLQVARNPRSGRKPKPREHGTVRGWWQHKYRGEPNCEPCRTARRAYDADRKAQRKAS